MTNTHKDQIIRIIKDWTIEDLEEAIREVSRHNFLEPSQKSILQALYYSELEERRRLFFGS